MPNTNCRESSVKYTALLPKACLDELKTLTERRIIPSVNRGIRLAVESFVSDQKQRAYEEAVREAAADKAFIKRTLEAQSDFAVAEVEIDPQHLCPLHQIL